jgi:hypothetical protein
VLELPQWFHELATMATLAVAAAWLTVHVVRISRPRGSRPGCARCEHNPVSTAAAHEQGGRRSEQLRVIG